MRYLIVKYLKRPNGQLDEIVGVSKKVKLNDLQTAAVILDFQKGQVLQASMEGVTIPRDFPRIRDFYQQHYKRLIDDLESVYGRFDYKELSTPDTTPESN
jgi:hypothetical protein